MPLLPPQFDAVVWYGMLVLGIAVPSLCMRLLASKPRHLSLAVLAWAGISAWVASRGGLLNVGQLPPAIVWLTLPPLLAVFFAARDHGARLWRHTVSLRTVLWIQSFRLPLELLMWRAAQQGIMPSEFSVQGYNLDLFTGLSALLLALAWPRLATQTAQRLAQLWNAWGIFCLLVIAVLVVLTSPQVHFFGAQAEHINSWVLFFPYVWLPSLLVPCAVLGHVLIWKNT